MARGAELYRSPSGKPASIASRIRLQIPVSSPSNAAGGVHGSTVWTSSPSGYSSVRLPIWTLSEVEPFRLPRRPCDVDLRAVHADVCSAVVLGDPEALGVFGRHGGERVDETAGVHIRAGLAASLVGIARDPRRALAGRGVGDRSLVSYLVCEIGQDLDRHVDEGVVVFADADRFHQRVEPH